MLGELNAEHFIKKLKSYGSTEKDVNIIGAASTAPLCLNAGLADELHVDMMPVLLGGGLRPFEGLDVIERLDVMALPGGRTHLKFRVVK